MEKEVQNVSSEGTKHFVRPNHEDPLMPPRRNRHSHTAVRVDEHAEIGISAADALPTGEAEVTLTIDAGRSGTIELTGSGWDLHRLVIDIDRQLTRLSRQPRLSTSY